MKVKIIAEDSYYCHNLAKNAIVEVVPNMEADGADVFNAPIGMCYLCIMPVDNQCKYIPATCVSVINDYSELREKYAGMAMQAILSGVTQNTLLMEQMARRASNEGCSSLSQLIARDAVGYAEDLVLELKKREKGLL